MGEYTAGMCVHGLDYAAVFYYRARTLAHCAGLVRASFMQDDESCTLHPLARESMPVRKCGLGWILCEALESFPAVN